MKINLRNAVATFYPNPSFDQIYFEAVANAIDAGASAISIEVKIESYDKPDTLSLRICDNGTGFKPENFSKFSKLLEVEADDHKGMGRLVYLAYFRDIRFTSNYNGTKKREFNFNTEFSGTSIEADEIGQSGTTIDFRHYKKQKIYKYSSLSFNGIKQSLLSHFFPILYSLKQTDKTLEIKISTEVTKPNPEYGFDSGATVLTLADLPPFKCKTFSSPFIDALLEFKVYYNIEKDDQKPKSIQTSIGVDGRAMRHDLLPLDALPLGHQATFIFISPYFRGKTDSTRQELEKPDRQIERELRKMLSQIMDEEMPIVATQNLKTKNELSNRYPHLSGYFPEDPPGLIIKAESLKSAQDRFFEEQKKILECDHLDKAQYEKAVEFSSRALMEYILYRAKIIESIKALKPENHEKDLHNLIVPMGDICRQETFDEHLFKNNAWILDDKFMSYKVILSDKKMTEVLKEITLDGGQDAGEPDLAIIFSKDPTAGSKVNAVVVELKRLGIDVFRKSDVIGQLQQRAEKLLALFPDRIERLWFYGVVDIDGEFRRTLINNDFKELFSLGHAFVRTYNLISGANEQNRVPVDIFVMNYDSLIRDAESRNETFMRILKTSVQKAYTAPAGGSVPANS